MASFALWVGYGVWLVRRQGSARPQQHPWALEGPLWLLSSVFALALGYLGLQGVGGFVGDTIAPLGWLVIALAGLAFVHCQTTGVSKMLASAAIGVTSQTSPSSSQRDSENASHTSQQP